MSKGVVQGVLENVNSILGLRDSLGAALKDVYFVTRTWSGSELGAGSKTDTKVKMVPSPRVVEFKQDARIVEGGAIKQGDILLKMISKQSYPTETYVDGRSNVANIEHLYEVGGVLYRVVNVTEKHVTWTVLLRKLSSR